MREKLLALMKNEGLKSSQLAEMLEINPAGISHILAGRNKPSFELLQKILRRFPRINPDWLLLDSPQMYRSNYEAGGQPGNPASTNPSQAKPEAGMNPDLGLFGNHASEISGNGPEMNQAGRAASAPFGTSAAEHGTAAESAIGVNEVIGNRNHAAVRRIVIFYEDQTFECYFPTRR